MFSCSPIPRSARAAVLLTAACLGLFCSAPKLQAQIGAFVPAPIVAPATPLRSPAAAAANEPHSAAKPTAGAAAKLPAPPTVNVDVAEWVVFVADVAHPMLNGKELFRDTLPDFAGDLRSAAAATSQPDDSSNSPGGVAQVVFVNGRAVVAAAVGSAAPDVKAAAADDSKPPAPCPIGLIRLSADGPIDRHTKVDVRLGLKSKNGDAVGGRALGHWPRAKARWASLLWEDVSLDAGSGEERNLPAGSWLAELRGGSLPLVSGTTRESFLLYDLEMRYPVRMVVSAHEGRYTFRHSMDAPLHDVTFYKRQDDHWQSATLAAKRAASKSATSTAPSLGARSSDAPGAIEKGTDVEFAFGSAKETDDTVLAPWRSKLAAANVSAADQEVILKILAHHALDPNLLTAIYRLDPAELDRILPLEIVPQPKKISRIALVIVRGLDPALNSELDLLFKKLSDPSWKVREAATQAIRKLGLSAKRRLESAVNDKDTEVAYRAEQLLQDIAGAGKHN